MSEERKAVLIQFPSERMANDFISGVDFPKSVTVHNYSEKQLAQFYIDIAKLRGEVVEQDRLPNETGLVMGIQGLEYGLELLNMVLRQVSRVETKKRTKQ